MKKTVKPIPEGFHALTPYIIVKGLPQAVEFYKKAFGAVAKDMCPGPDGKVCHAELKINDSMLMIGEESAEWGAFAPVSGKGTSVMLCLYVVDCDKVFEAAVKAGGKVKMPMADQPWGDRMGKLVDPFGHEWSVTTHKEDVTQEQIAERMKKAFAVAAN